jgi:hypothetical protein
MLISKIIFLKIKNYYFNIFPSKKYLKNVIFSNIPLIVYLLNLIFNFYFLVFFYQRNNIKTY